MDNFTPQPIAKPSLDATTRDRLGSTPTGAIPPLAPQPESSSFFARNKWFVVVLILAVVIIATLAFLAMRKPGTTQDAKVAIDLVVPAEVPSSSEAVIKAVVTNNDSRHISEGELELIFPEGAVFVSSNPPAENLSGTSYKLPALSPGANVTIFTKLRFEGGVGQQRTVQGRLSYKITGLSAEFSKTANAGLKLVAAGVSIDIQGPQAVTNAQLVSYTVHYVNQSTESFDRVRIKMVFPQGFQFAESTPKPSQGTDTWDIGALVAGAQGDIVLNGTFNSSTPGQGVSLAVQLQVPDKNGSYYTQAENSFATSIGSQPLVVSQLVQGGAQDASVATPGDSLQYKINYQNNATIAARGVRIVFTVDSTTADLSTIQAEGANINGNTVTWSAASKPDLEVLNPNESGSVSLTIRIKNPPVSDRTINPDLVTNVKIKADEYDTFLPGNKLQIKLATKLQMDLAQGYLSGQRPPRVGQETQYTVTVSLRNSTNDITQGSLSLFIATGTNSFDKASISGTEANKVTYDPSTGKLVWRFDTLKAHTGDFAPARTLQFTLRVVPSASQAARALVLVKNVQLAGKDANTGKDVTAALSELSTTDGPNGNNDGIVQQ